MTTSWSRAGPHRGSHSRRPGSDGPSSWSERPATTRQPMASCWTWREAGSATSRSCATPRVRHRLKRYHPTRSTNPSPTTTRTRLTRGPPSTPPGPALEAADVELGLRYLTDFAVVVLAEPADPATIAVVADATRWGEARMVLVVAGRTDGPRRSTSRRRRLRSPALRSRRRVRRPGRRLRCVTRRGDRGRRGVPQLDRVRRVDRGRRLLTTSAGVRAARSARGRRVGHR